MKVVNLFLGLLPLYGVNGYVAYSVNDYNAAYGTARTEKNFGWHLGERYCNEQLGSNLATINSLAENNEAYHLCVAATADIGIIVIGSCWIGYNDIDSESEYEWIETGSDGSYTNWVTGQPGQDCAYFIGDNSLNPTNKPKWNDFQCSPIDLNIIISGFVCNGSPCQSPVIAGKCKMIKNIKLFQGVTGIIATPPGGGICKFYSLHTHPITINAVNETMACQIDINNTNDIYDIEICAKYDGLSGIHPILTCNSRGTLNFGEYIAIIKNSENKKVQITGDIDEYQFLNPKTGHPIKKMPFTNSHVAVKLKVKKRDVTRNYQIQCF